MRICDDTVHVVQMRVRSDMFDEIVRAVEYLHRSDVRAYAYDPLSTETFAAVRDSLRGITEIGRQL